MKTIKLIDLLNKIVKDEELPIKIKYEGCEYFREHDGFIFYYVDNNGRTLLSEIESTIQLIDLVEIEEK